MYISNMTHFLDDSGNIPEEMPKSGRQLASFHALVVDITTRENQDALDKLRCFKKKCEGFIISQFSADNDEILWDCTKCDNGGRISFWQGTKWDNSKKS